MTDPAVDLSKGKFQMGFFRRLKEQVLWQQQIELIMLEACENNTILKPKICKMLTRECISLARELNVFENKEIEILSRQDRAFLFLMQFLIGRAQGMARNDPMGVFVIRALYGTILKISNTPHLKLTPGVILVAEQDLDKFPMT